MRVLVGMSGGVDSSLAAALLQEAGHEVTGGFIKNWSDTKDWLTGECYWRQERRDALRVAARLGIKLLTFDFEKSYREKVLARMLLGYAAGVTPNPDIWCNSEIKFGLFFAAAMKLGFAAVATGHYAIVKHAETAVARLYCAVDETKDQSYFLHRISQTALQRSYFPLGELHKSEVREMARVRNLLVADKPDSQGICFIGKTSLPKFLRQRLSAQSGKIVTPEGKVLGHHTGLDTFTIGQRQRIGISSDHHAWYVADKDMSTNRLIVVPDRQHPLLWSKEALVKDIHWCGADLSLHDQTIIVDVVPRYHATAVKAELSLVSRQDGLYKLIFSEPVWAVTPGQAAVFYQQNECLGGGLFISHQVESR